MDQLDRTGCKLVEADVKTFIAVAALLASAVALRAECRTPADVPCHTIEFRNSQWVLFRRSFTDVQHSNERSTHAVRSDGSRYRSDEHAAQSSVSMYVAAQDRVIRVFPSDRTFSSRAPLIWHDRPSRRASVRDAICVSAIRHHGTDFRHIGTETLLGVNVQRWWRSLGNGGNEDIWFAPELACAALRHETVYRNALRLPTFIDSMQAVAIRWGEPDPKLFTIPADYREIEDPALPRLREYMQRARR